MNMDVSIELVTPQIAKQYLGSNRSNRKLRTAVVRKYADDMKSGKWTQCPMPVAFYVDGDVADGQHRLSAVIESGIPQQFIVMRGLTREAGLNIDTNLTRSIVDAVKISGVDSNVSHAMIATARAVEEGIRATGVLSNSQKLALVEKHREAVEWVIAYGPKGSIVGNSLVRGALARAWYHENNTDRLARYAEVIGSGFSDGASESAAIAMRNHLMQRGTVAANLNAWRDTFLKTQNSIHYFMRGRQLKVIKSVSDEVYPLLGPLVVGAKKLKVA